MTTSAIQARNEAAGPLSECPRCGYALVGLPADHACPECGLAYDAATRCWRMGRPWRRLLLLGIVNLIMVAIAVVAQRVYSTFGLAPPKLWFGYGVMAIGLAQFAITFWAVLCRPFVAVLPDGLRWRLRGQADCLVPWRDVLGVVVRPVGRRNLVRVTFDASPWTLDVTSLLRDATAGDVFAACVNARIRRARTE